MGLELLEGLGGVVDQSEAGALTTTVLCAETEDGDLVLVGLVQVGQLLTELVLGDVGAVGVEDVPRYSRKDVRSVFSGFSMLVSVCVCACCEFRLHSSFSFFFLCWVVVEFQCCAPAMHFPHTDPKRGGKSGGFLHDHLLAGKQRVADELASPQSDGRVGHFGVCVGWRKCRRGL